MFNKLNFNYNKKEINLKKNQIINDLKLKNKKTVEDLNSLNKTLNIKKILNNETKNDLNKLLNTIKQNDENKESKLNPININNFEFKTINNDPKNDLNKVFHTIKPNEILNTFPLNINEIPNFALKNNDKILENISRNQLTNFIDKKMQIINNIKSLGITTINNVYQLMYKDNIKGTGLGDFIRGSYFLMEFCSNYKFNYKIILNNKIKDYLQNKQDLYIPPIISKNIISMCDNNIVMFMFSKDNYILEPKKNPNILNNFTEYLKKSVTYKKELLIYCTSYPINEITEDNKKMMQKILEPTNEIKMSINNIFHKLLIQPKKYITLHIRCGDNYLNDELNNMFKKTYITQLTNDIKKINLENCLLISDNNNVKSILLQFFPKIKTLFKEIIHLCESDTHVENNEKIKNTLIEFYLMSFSKEIKSYSCYEHGSGFSYWCAKTFNIPYSCKYMPTS